MCNPIRYHLWYSYVTLEYILDIPTMPTESSFRTAESLARILYCIRNGRHRFPSEYDETHTHYAAPELLFSYSNTKRLLATFPQRPHFLSLLAPAARRETAGTERRELQGAGGSKQFSGKYKTSIV